MFPRDIGKQGALLADNFSYLRLQTVYSRIAGRLILGRQQNDSFNTQRHHPLEVKNQCANAYLKLHLLYSSITNPFIAMRKDTLVG